MMLTYEDGMVMSRSTSKRYAYRAKVSCIIKASTRHILEVGSIIEPYREKKSGGSITLVVQSSL